MMNAIVTYSDFEQAIRTLGYTNLKKINNKKIAILTNANRAELLRELNQKIKGSSYNSDARESSAGAVLYNGYTILAKPISKNSVGRGTDATTLNESAQCLYCAAKWYHGGKYDNDTLNTAYANVSIETKLELENIPSDWIESFIKTADVLYEKFSKKQYTFHRGSKWVQVLEKKFADLNKKEKEFSNLNKWSPADIYLVAHGYENEDFSTCDTITALNEKLMKHLQDETIIGVSLKKTKSPNLKYINHTEKRETIRASTPYFSLGTRDFFSTASVYTYYEGGAIQFRSFKPVDFQGEIRGKHACHGKVGCGIIKNMIQKTVGKEIRTASEVVNHFRHPEKRKVLTREFYTYYTHLETDPVSEEEFNRKLEHVTSSWFISKFIGCQTLYFIDNSKKVDTIIGSIIRYAASQSDMSAPYAKVE